MLLDTDIVKQHRHQRGWTQEHVATLCDLSVRTIQRCEKTGVASMETSQALAAAFGVEYISLLADGGVKTGHSGINLNHLLLSGVTTFVIGLVIGGVYL